jgi:hypothetical protein
MAAVAVSLYGTAVGNAGHGIASVCTANTISLQLCELL